MTLRRISIALAVALVAVAVAPSLAHAWTPGTHVFLGESVLANLASLPGWVVELVRAFPYDYLYGSIAADTSVAKKYAPVGRHCHSWHVGREIYERAETESLRAFGLGYLSHLAADTVAHNHFVPRQLVITSRTIALGHSWWESRFETHLGEQYARTAMDLIRLDHSASDDHLDNLLSPTIFSVRTSRRLFRGMVGLIETQSWQSAFRAIAENSRWDLEDEDIDSQMGMSFDLIMEMLSRLDGEPHSAQRLDPSGHFSLKLAKAIRLDVLKGKIPADIRHLSELAEENFGLPESPADYWENSQSHRPWAAPPEVKEA